MGRNTLIKAWRGMLFWRRNLLRHSDRFFLIIPAADYSLVEALFDRFDPFLKLQAYEYTGVTVFYSCQDISDLIPAHMDAVFVQGRQMEALCAYYSLTCQQHGVCHQKNVRMVSIEHVFGGQLDKLKELGIYSLDTIIDEYIP